VPNLVVSAPKDENELQHLLYTASKSGQPMAIRYPRGAGLGVKLDKELHPITIGKGEILRHGQDAAILAIGTMVAPCLEAAEELSSKGVEVTVVNARFAKPLDSQLVVDLASGVRRLITAEENTLNGGFGSNIAHLLQKSRISDIQVRSLGLPDRFIEHGSLTFLRSKYGLDASGIASQVLSLLATPTPLPEIKTRA